MNTLANVTNGDLSVRYGGASGIGNRARERGRVLSDEVWRKQGDEKKKSERSRDQLHIHSAQQERSRRAAGTWLLRRKRAAKLKLQFAVKSRPRYRSLVPATILNNFPAPGDSRSVAASSNTKRNLLLDGVANPPLINTLARTARHPMSNPPGTKAGLRNVGTAIIGEVRSCAA